MVDARRTIVFTAAYVAMPLLTVMHSGSLTRAGTG